MGNVSGYQLLWDQAAPQDDRKFIRVEPVSYGLARKAFIVTEADPAQPWGKNMRFVLFATRYHKDRLNIVVWDYTSGDTNEYAGLVRKWLKMRWGNDNRVIERLPESAPPVGLTIERPTVYAGSDVKTTLVHYLVKNNIKTLTAACDLVRVAPKTYRNHRKLGKLLSDENFKRRTEGTSIKDAAQEVIRGEWYTG